MTTRLPPRPEVSSGSFAAYLERRRVIDAAAERFAADARELGFEVDREVAAEGFRFDLAVRSGEGRSVLVDFLSGLRRSSLTLRQRDYVARAFMITAQTKAQVMYVLVPIDSADAERKTKPPFVMYSEALPRLRELIASAEHAPATLFVVDASEIFVAMPFSSAHGPTRYKDVYQHGIRHAAQVVGLGTFRVDYKGAWDDIVHEIRSHIQSALFVVADISETKANVLYEIGYAHAIGKTTVLITSESTARAPFDVAHHKIHTYDIHDTAALSAYLRRAFRDLMRSYGRLPPDRRRRENRTAAGASRARPVRAANKAS